MCPPSFSINASFFRLLLKAWWSLLTTCKTNMQSRQSICGRTTGSNGLSLLKSHLTTLSGVQG
ncbi:hypothetical protein FKM82_024191 [Ascaphus truei]